MTPTSAEIVALEQLLAHGWQGTSVRRRGDWLLRAGSGFTGRANSVLPLGDPGVDLERALTEIGQFYAEHDLPPVFQLPEGATDELEAELERRGWAGYNRTEVRVGELAVLGAADSSAGAILLDRPDDQWLNGYLYRGSPLPPSAVAVLTRADRPVFVAIRRGAVQLGVARGVVHDGLLGITAVTVDAAHRRRGVGRELMAALGAWGADQGATAVYLQVDESNTVARAVYDTLGIRTHHRYHYRRQPGS